MTEHDDRLERLAGGVAHDFNNLLTSITALSALALQELPAGHPTRPDLVEIERAAQRAVALTRQLLALAGRAAARPTAVDLNPTLSTIEPSLRRLVEPHANLEVLYGDHIPPVLLDPKSFEQLLGNLVAYARDAAGQEGRVAIETGMDTAAGYAVVTVRDSGPAEHPDDAAHLLEPFWTTRGGRKLGLGLAAAAALARQYGGRVDVRVATDRSPTLEVRLPLAQRSSATEVPAPGDPPGMPLDATVLAVDDDASILRLVRRILEGAGYHVIGAADVPEALARAGEVDGAFDLLLTDVTMPGGSGQDLAAALRARWPRVRVLYMSGYTDDPAVRRVAGTGEGGYLSKPFGPDALLQAVRRALDAGPQTLADR